MTQTWKNKVEGIQSTLSAYPLITKHQVHFEGNKNAWRYTRVYTITSTAAAAWELVL